MLSLSASSTDRFARAAAVAALLVCGASGALAQTTGSVASHRPTLQRVDLGIGKSFVFDLPRDAKEVFVADPTVANAVVRSPRKIFIIGLKKGVTSVFIHDSEGRQIAAAEIASGRDMDELRRLLKTAMPSSNIRVVAVGDSIVLEGEVDNAGEAARALSIAEAFVGYSAVGGPSAGAAGAGGSSIAIGSATVVHGTLINALTIRGKDQVMLKVVVAEVQRAVIKQFGVDSVGNWSLGKLPVTPLSENPFPIQLQPPSRTNVLFGRETDGARLRAFERAGVLRTLAEPTLTAISGESAKFMAGGEIPVPRSESCTPIPGQTQMTCQVGIEMKPFGVSLVFQPVVLSAGRISLRVATEVTEIDSENQFRFNQIVVPAFRVRKSDTTIELPSGGSIVTAGLIQQQQKQVINGMPALMNLPVLGALFRSRDYQKLETELLIIVTPYIAKPSTASQLARPDEGYVEAKDPQTVIMGRFNKIYGVAGAPNDGGRYRGTVGFISD